MASQVTTFKVTQYHGVDIRKIEQRMFQLYRAFVGLQPSVSSTLQAKPFILLHLSKDLTWMATDPVCISQQMFSFFCLKTNLLMSSWSHVSHNTVLFMLPHELY